MISDNMPDEQTTEYRLNNCLEALSPKYGFFYSVVDMKAMEDKFKNNDKGLFSVLSEAELDYLGKTRLFKNRLQWVSGRYAVKSALFKYKFKTCRSIIDLRTFDILKGANSAPFVSQYPDIGVSITHSFPFCIGIVCDRRIGVDIERINKSHGALIQYFFSHKEKEVLKNKTNDHDYSVQSMIYWTRKEAVSKLLGLGMKMNFRELDTTKEEIILDYPESINIKLSSCIKNDFCLSLATEQVGDGS
jgi:phosphopantetheinyl transferase (holo-ACP synthase)